MAGGLNRNGSRSEGLWVHVNVTGQVMAAATHKSKSSSHRILSQPTVPTIPTIPTFFSATSTIYFCNWQTEGLHLQAFKRTFCFFIGPNPNVFTQNKRGLRVHLVTQGHA